MPKNLFAPQRRVLLSDLSPLSDLYLVISCSGDVLILSCTNAAIQTRFKARWPAHTFGEPLSVTWIGSLPLVASQKGLLLCIDLDDDNRVSCLDGFRGQGIIAIGSLLGKLIVLEHSGLLRFFDVCKDPLMNWKVANEATHLLSLKLSGLLTEYRLFIKMVCTGRWCVVVTSTDSVIILDFEALRKRWSLGIDTAMLPVTLLSIDGRCEARGSNNVIYKVNSNDAIIDAIVSVDADTGLLSYLAFLLWDRSVVLCNVKATSTNQNLPPVTSSVLRRANMDRSALRGSAARRNEATIAATKLLDVAVSRFEPSGGLDNCPSEFGVLSTKGMWVQRNDRRLLVFADLNLGLVHKTVDPVGMVDALNAVQADDAPGDFLVLGYDGMIMGYNTIEHGPRTASAKTNYAS